MACRHIAALLCWGALLAFPHDARANKLSADEARRLKSGEIVTRTWKIPGSSVGTGVAIGVIDAAPARVFEVIANVGSYKKFMKRVVESRVTRREGETYFFYYKIDMPAPLSDYWFITKNRNTVDGKRQIYTRRWTLHQGSFARNDGYWDVRPWPGGRSVVTYSTVLKPKSAIPQFIINYVTQKSLPRGVASIRARVMQLKRRTDRSSR